MKLNSYKNQVDLHSYEAYKTKQKKKTIAQFQEWLRASLEFFIIVKTLNYISTFISLASRTGKFSRRYFLMLLAWTIDNDIGDSALANLEYKKEFLWPHTPTKKIKTKTNGSVTSVHQSPLLSIHVCLPHMFITKGPKYQLCRICQYNLHVRVMFISFPEIITWNT